MNKDFDYVFNQTVLPTNIGGVSFSVETNGRILVLEQYKELFNRVMAIKKDKPVSKGILLTGQPGVGMFSHFNLQTLIPCSLR